MNSELAAILSPVAGAVTVLILAMANYYFPRGSHYEHRSHDNDDDDTSRGRHAKPTPRHDLDDSDDPMESQET